MSEQTRISHPKESLLCADVEGFDSLAELALDMRSSWNHATDQVWQQLDPVLWDLTHNPWVVLQTVSREKLQRVLADPAFRKNVDYLVRARRDAAEALAVLERARSFMQATGQSFEVALAVTRAAISLRPTRRSPTDSGGRD